MTAPRQRRDVLRALAAGSVATTVSLAGCTGGSGDGDATDDGDEQAAADATGTQGSADGLGGGELPSYHRFVPVDVDGSEGVTFVALDAERLRSMEGRDLQRELPADARVNLENDGGQADADPMLSIPGSGLFITTLGLAFGLAPYGFASGVIGGFTNQMGSPSGGQSGGQSGSSSGGGGTGDAGGTSTGGDSPHRVDLAVMAGVGEVVAFEGSFDTGAIAERSAGFERVGEYAGFEVYEGSEGDSTAGSGGSPISTENLAFAVDGSRLVALMDNELDDPRGRLDHALDVAVGDAERLSADGDADWALRTAGHDLVTLGGWGTASVQAGVSQGGTGQGGQSGGGAVTDSVLGDADGVVASLAVGEDQVTSTLASVYPDGETPDREQFEGEVGSSASERTVEFDGTRTSATATWPTASGTPTTAAGGSDGDGEATTTAASSYETVVDEQLSESKAFTLEFAEGDEVRVTVENLDGERTLVYMQQLGGSELPINDQTSSSETWEVTIADGGEYSVDFTVDGEAQVTIEVA